MMLKRNNQIEQNQDNIDKKYLNNKSLLYIGSLENNGDNIEAFKKKFKHVKFSSNSEYILKNIDKYDIILYIDTEDIELLQSIRKVDPYIPAIVYTHEETLLTMKYLNYNISHFTTKNSTTSEIVLVLQYELKKFDTHKQQILSQKEQQEYLKILDEFIIISKTDLKGKITYVNDIFCEISGYNKEELIGSPHNIVRHPDMPKVAFQTMWETIKKDSLWTGVVKNRAKNGETYIAKSTVMPYYEDDIKIGYIGLRYVVTDEITEKSAVKSHFVKTVVDFKKQIREKDKEIEKLKETHSDNYYLAWENELKRKEKLQHQLESVENKQKELEKTYSTRINKFLSEKRENYNIISKKNLEIDKLKEAKDTLEVLISDYEIDLEKKVSYIKELQKRNQDLEEILSHNEEQLNKLQK